MSTSIDMLNEEVYSRIPYKDETQHLYACSINLILAGQYLEGYEKYKEYLNRKEEVALSEKYKIVTFITSRMLKIQKYDAVATLLLEVKDEFEGDPFIYNNLAVSLVKIGKVKLAAETLKSAYCLHPEHVELKKNYSKLERYLHA